MTSCTFDLPFPAKILWPNGRGHHMAKHRAFQEHKRWAYYATQAATPMLLCDAAANARVDWTVTVHPKTGNAIDDDNARASMKAYQDGIALALGVNDSAFNAPVLTFAEPVKGGRMTLTIQSTKGE